MKLVIWTWFVLLCGFSGILSAAPPPNIIVIMPDDMGWGDVAAHGNPLIKTPSLDRLYSQSLRFTDFHVSPTCAPRARPL